MKKIDEIIEREKDARFKKKIRGEGYPRIVLRKSYHSACGRWTTSGALLAVLGAQNGLPWPNMFLVGAAGRN